MPASPLPPSTLPSRSALEVALLLVTLGALVLGAFGSWKHTCTAMLATVTAILVPICNTVFELGAGGRGAGEGQAMPRSKQWGAGGGRGLRWRPPHATRNAGACTGAAVPFALF